MINRAASLGITADERPLPPPRSLCSCNFSQTFRSGRFSLFSVRMGDGDSIKEIEFHENDERLKNRNARRKWRFALESTNNMDIVGRERGKG